MRLSRKNSVVFKVVACCRIFLTLLLFLSWEVCAAESLGRPKTGLSLQAENLLVEQKYEEALPKFRQLIQRARFQAPMTRQQTIDYAFAHDGLSVCLSNLGELELAAQHAKKALDAGKSRRDYPKKLLSTLYNNLAYLLEQQGKNLEALAYYDASVRLMPPFDQMDRSQTWDSVVHWGNIGQLNQTLGREALAWEAYRNAYASSGRLNEFGKLTQEELWQTVYVRARLAAVEKDSRQQRKLLQEGLDLIPGKAFADPRRLETLRLLIETHMSQGEKERALALAQDLWRILIQAHVEPEHRYHLLYFIAQFWRAVGQHEEIQRAVPVVRDMYARLSEKERFADGWNALFGVQGLPVRENFLRFMHIAGAQAAYVTELTSGSALGAVPVCDSSSGQIANLGLDEQVLVRLERADLAMAKLRCSLDAIRLRQRLAVTESAPDDELYVMREIASLAQAKGQMDVAEGQYRELLDRLVKLRLSNQLPGAWEVEARLALSRLLFNRGQLEAAEELKKTVQETLLARVAEWGRPDLSKPNLRPVVMTGSYRLRAGGEFITTSRSGRVSVHEQSRGAYLYSIAGLDPFADQEISPDGRWTATVKDGFIYLIDTAGLRLAGVIPFDSNLFNTFQFSPDGQFLTTANGKVVRTWSVPDATLAWEFFPNAGWGERTLLRYSRDSRFVYLSYGQSAPGVIEKLDALSGKRLTQSDPLETQAIFVSADGRTLVAFVGSLSDEKYWVLRLNADSLAVEGLITLSSCGVYSSADLFSPSGQYLAIPERHEIGFWDTSSWQPLARYPSRSRAYAWRQDETLIGLTREEMSFFRAGEGAIEKSLGGEALRMTGLGFSEDGERLVLRSANRFVHVELKTGGVVAEKHPQDGLGGLARLWPDSILFNKYWSPQSEEQDGLTPFAIDVSNDGRYRSHLRHWLSVERFQAKDEGDKPSESAWSIPLNYSSKGYWEGIARFALNNREIGLVELQDFNSQHQGDHSSSFAFQRRDAETGKVLGSLMQWTHASERPASPLGLFPERANDFLLFLADGSLTRIQSKFGGRELIWQNKGLDLEFALEANRSLVSGNILVTGKNALLLLDGKSGKIHWDQRLPFSQLKTAVVSPDDRFVAAVGEDGTVLLLDGKTGERLLKMYFFADGDWAAVDPDYRFDSLHGGEVSGLHWVVGSTSIELAQLKERYFEPGLIPRALKLSAEKSRPVAEFVDPKLFPKVESRLVNKDGTHAIEVFLTNQGGGIGVVRVSLNGKEVLADARPNGFDAQVGFAKLTVSLPGYLVRDQGQNEVEVVAWNAEGYLASRGARVRYEREVATNEAPPSLFAIVAGVSRYANPTLNLTFPAKDARDIAHALRLGASRLFGAQHAEITLFSDAPGEEGDGVQPVSREGLKNVFERIARKARPGDVLIVYLAGHGVMSSGEKSDYYFLTPEARSTDLSDPAIRESYGVSSAVMTEWIKTIPAMKQVMVLDTCAAGGAVDRLTQVRALSADQVRALDRLKDRTGFHVLMGAAADKVSYESSQYGQGLLTYAILQGMKGAALREGEYVDVSTLFQHAADQVPLLAKRIGGIQKPVIASPRGSSFDIGQMTSEDKRHVALADQRPMFLRAVLQDVRRPIDTLGIGRHVNRLLRDQAARAESAKLVFIDAEDLPGAYLLAGRYEHKGDRLRISASLYRDEMELSTKQIDLPKDKENTAGALLVEWALSNVPRTSLKAGMP